MAILEGLVLAWWAQKLYHVWSRLFLFVMTVRLPWQVKNEVEETDGIEAKTDEVQPKRGRHRQAAIDARNDYIKLFAVVTK